MCDLVVEFSLPKLILKIENGLVFDWNKTEKKETKNHAIYVCFVDCDICATSAKVFCQKSWNVVVHAGCQSIVLFSFLFFILIIILFVLIKLLFDMHGF